MILFSDTLIPQWLLLYLAHGSLMIRVKWISPSVSGLFRSQDRCFIFTIYYTPPPISLVQFTPLVQGLGWYSAFSVDVYAGSAHYAWWTSKSTHLTPAELLMSVSWNVKTCLRKGCDAFLHVFAVLLPTYKVICLCHNNSVSHFYHRLNSRKRGLGGIEKQWFVLFVPWHFSPSLHCLARTLVRMNLCVSFLCEHCLTKSDIYSLRAHRIQ